MVSSRYLVFLLLAGLAFVLTSAIRTPVAQEVEDEFQAISEDAGGELAAIDSELTGTRRNLLALSLEKWLFGSSSKSKKSKKSKKKAEEEEEEEE
eukprot:CAMPEP_0118932014 /NCGR_PEP_ID=MMETSP1169-20130426/8941_1 /TAXON_ID=36882 /ORGANISM="Pyramimonas obovata, Strain CCMP722" /LENGTH=94 /DNA_ID=CAMNT_0006874603 /DNA_START=151 /DNA_END=432 /DNA_ORIENTATION=+